MEILVEKVLEAIKDLPVKPALEYLAINKISNYFNEGYGKIKKIIQDKYNGGKYGFVPDKEEALILRQFDQNPQYNEITILVPNYRYLDILRTGLLIKKYNQDRENEKNKERIGRIKKDILNRPNGQQLLKIVNLPTTNFFSTILKYLYELKIHSYTEKHLEEEFNSLVEDWNKSCLFIDNNHEIDDIVNFCSEEIKNGNRRFFLLAMYEPNINKLKKGISKIWSEEFFKIYKYGYQIFERGDERDPPMIEVVVRKDLLSP